MIGKKCVRDLIYEQDLSRRIKQMTAMLDSFRGALGEWGEKDRLGAERAFLVLVDALVGLSRYAIYIASGINTLSSRDVVDELRRQDMVSKEVYDRLLKIMDTRNVLVHDYLAVNDGVIFSILEKRDYGFIEEVLDLLFGVLASPGQWKH